MEDDTFELETPADFDDAEVFEEEDAEDAEDIPESQHEAMPDAVRKFIVLFHKQLLQKDVEKITVIYHFSFSKLTDRFVTHLRFLFRVHHHHFSLLAQIL